jgi:nicotinamidase-related amidase
METLQLAPATTALIVIDLQRGILARDVNPHSSTDVLRRSVAIADACRKAGALVVLVRVAFSSDGLDRLAPKADSVMPAGTVPADFADIAAELGPKPGDMVITKRQWGAFYGTELDLQLRRRGVRTLLFTGIATNIGVESTARDAYERGYEQVFVEDAMASLIPGGHAFATTMIFPRMGLVRSTADVLAALTAG